MRTVVIIEDEFSQKGSLAKMCSQWPDNFKVHSALDEKSGEEIIREKKADLIICNLSSGYGPQLETLTKICHIFPYIPVIAIIDKAQDLEDKVLAKGAAECLYHPVVPADLRLQVHRMLDESASGIVKGIPVHSLLQMLETDEKNCTLIVREDSKTGRIYLEDGAVVAAETKDQAGEEAVYSIITWENGQVEIRYYNRQRQREIDQPLISLIMEAFRLKDEKEEIEKSHDDKETVKPKIKLQHFLTSGNRLSLEMGAKIKIEQDGEEGQLISTMVGMVPNEFIIISAPEPHDLAKEMLQEKSRLVVKYLHMGRLCIFKTWLKGRLSSPVPLLFLDYPSVVHFHELRRAKRTTIFVPSTLQFEEKELEGVLLDLSSKGCLYKTKVSKNMEVPQFDIDSLLYLKSLLPGVEEKQILPGLVKNIKKTTNELLLGIEFMQLEDSLIDAIEYYVESVEKLNSD